jgi:hypothetical protein
MATGAWSGDDRPTEAQPFVRTCAIAERLDIVAFHTDRHVTLERLFEPLGVEVAAPLVGQPDGREVCQEH